MERVNEFSFQQLNKLYIETVKNVICEIIDVITYMNLNRFPTYNEITEPLFIRVSVVRVILRI